MKTLIDSPQLRKKRADAYRAGAYKFNPPPVYAGGWDSQAWMNWVQFDDPSLTGFLPYVKTVIIRNGVAVTLSA